jgi:Helix-hairpin-helix motif
MKRISLFILLIGLLGGFIHGQESDSVWNQLEWLNQEYVIDEFHLDEIKKVNLNGNRLTELLKLSFITYSDIQKILRYRDAHGGFTNVLELSRVDGITNEQFKQLQPYIEVIPDIQFLSGKNFQHEIITKWKVSWMNPRAYTLPSLWSEQFRYKGSWGSNWKMGVCTTKDAGETFEHLHYWFKSGFAYWQSDSRRWSILLGDYQIQWGQGSLAPKNFFQSSNWLLTSFFQAREGIIPYQSTIENFQKRGWVIHYKTKHFSVLTGVSSIAVHGSADSLSGFKASSETVFDDSLARSRWRAGVRNTYFLLLRYQMRNWNYGMGIYGDTAISRFSSLGFMQPAYGFSVGHLKGNHHAFGELSIQSDQTNFILGCLMSPHPKWQWGILFNRTVQLYGVACQSSLFNIQGEWKVHARHGILWGWNKSSILSDPENIFILKENLFFQWNFIPMRNQQLYYRCIKEQPSDWINQGKKENVFHFRRDIHRLDANLACLPTLTVHGRFEWLLDNRFSNLGKYAFMELDVHPFRFPIKCIVRHTFFDSVDWELRRYVLERGVTGSFYMPALYGRGTRQYLILSGSYHHWNIQVKYSVFSYQSNGAFYRWQGHLNNERNQTFELRIAYQLDGFLKN